MRSKAARKRQYTVRGVPPEVDRALREHARRRNTSLNEAIIEVIRLGVLPPDEARAHDDLDHLFGAQAPDPGLDRRLEEQRRIDPDLWL